MQESLTKNYDVSKDYGRNIPARNKEALEIIETIMIILVLKSIQLKSCSSLSQVLFNFITKFLLQTLSTGHKKAHSQYHSGVTQAVLYLV